MVPYVKLGKSCGEVDGIPGKEVPMDAVQRTTNLRADQYAVYTNYRSPRTRNVIFPSLKKYVSCLMNESSDVAYPPLGVFLRSEL